MAQSSWFLSLLSNQLPKDVDQKDYPELDEIDFVVDDRDELWGKQQIREAYKKQDGSLDESRFDSDLEKALDKFKNYELLKSQNKLTKKLEAIHREELSVPMLEGGGTTPTPEPTYIEGSLIAQVMGKPTTPSWVFASVGVDRIKPYDIEDINGKKFNMVDVYGLEEMANRNVINKSTGELERYDKEGLAYFFDNMLNPRTIAFKDLPNGQSVPDMKDGLFYTREVEDGEDVLDTGKRVMSVWGPQAKKENIAGFSGGTLSALKDHTAYILKNALRSVNNTTWDMSSAVVDPFQNMAIFSGMTSGADFFEDFKTHFQANKAKVSEYGEYNPVSFEGGTPFVTDIAAQLLMARVAGGAANKAFPNWKHAPRAGMAPLALMASAEIQQTAENAGLDDKQAATIWAASLPGMFYLNNKFSGWVADGIAGKTKLQIYNEALNQASKGVGGSIADKIAAGLLTPEQFGATIGKNFWKGILKYSKAPVIKEGINEFTEEEIEYGAQVATAWLPRLIDQETQYDIIRKENEKKAFRYVDDNFNATEIGRGVLMSGIGGAGGGMMGKLAGKYIWKDAQDEDVRDLLQYKASGELGNLRQALDQMHQSADGIASKKVGQNRSSGKFEVIKPGREAEYMTMNDFVYKGLTDDIDKIDQLYDDQEVDKALAKLKAADSLLDDEQLKGLKMGVMQKAIKHNSVLKTLYSEMESLYKKQTKHDSARLNNKNKTENDIANDEVWTKKITANRKRITDILSGYYNDEYYERALYATLYHPTISRGLPEDDIKEYGAILASHKANFKDIQHLNQSFTNGIESIKQDNDIVDKSFAEARLLNDDIASNVITQPSVIDGLLTRLGISLDGITSTADLSSEINKNKAYNDLLNYGLTNDGQFGVLRSAIQAELTALGYPNGTEVKNLISLEKDPAMLSQLFKASFAFDMLDRFGDIEKDSSGQDRRVNINLSKRKRDPLQARKDEYFKLTLDKLVDVSWKEKKERKKYKSQYKKTVRKSKEFVPVKSPFPETADIDMRSVIADEQKKYNDFKTKNKEKDYHDDKKNLEKVIKSIDERITQVYYNSTVVPKRNMYQKHVNPVIQELLKEDFPSVNHFIEAKRKIIESINRDTKTAIASPTPLKNRTRDLDLFYTSTGNDLEETAESRNEIIKELLKYKKQAEELFEISQRHALSQDKIDRTANIKMVKTKVAALQSIIAVESPIADIINRKDNLGLSAKLEGILRSVSVEDESSVDMDMLFNAMIDVEQTMFEAFHDQRNTILLKLEDAINALRFTSEGRHVADNGQQQSTIINNFNTSTLKSLNAETLEEVDQTLRDIADGKQAASQTTHTYLFQILTFNPKVFYDEHKKIQQANIFINNNEKIPSWEQIDRAHLAVAFKSNNNFDFYGADKLKNPPNPEYDNSGAETKGLAGRPKFFKYSLVIQGTVGSGKTSIVSKYSEEIYHAIEIRKKSYDKALESYYTTSSEVLKYATVHRSENHGVVYHATKEIKIGTFTVAKDKWFKIVKKNGKMSVETLNTKDVSVAKYTRDYDRRSFVFSHNKKVEQEFNDALGGKDRHNICALDSAKDIAGLKELLTSLAITAPAKIPFDTLYLDEVTLFSDFDLFGGYVSNPDNTTTHVPGILQLIDIINSNNMNKKDFIKVVFTGDLLQASAGDQSIIDYGASRSMKSEPITIRRRTGAATLVEFMDKVEHAIEYATAYQYAGKKHISPDLEGINTQVIDFAAKGEYYLKEDKAAGLKTYNNYQTIVDDIVKLRQTMANNKETTFAYIVNDQAKKDLILSTINSIRPDTLGVDEVKLVGDLQGETFSYGFIDLDPEGMDVSNKGYALDYYRELNSAIGRFTYFGGLMSTNFVPSRWSSEAKLDVKSVRRIKPEPRDAAFVDNYLASLERINTEYVGDIIVGEDAINSTVNGKQRAPRATGPIVTPYSPFTTKEQVVEEVVKMGANKKEPIKDTEVEDIILAATKAWKSDKGFLTNNEIVNIATSILNPDTFFDDSMAQPISSFLNYEYGSGEISISETDKENKQTIKGLDKLVVGAAEAAMTKIFFDGNQDLEAVTYTDQTVSDKLEANTAFDITVSITSGSGDVWNVPIVIPILKVGEIMSAPVNERVNMLSAEAKKQMIDTITDKNKGYMDMKEYKKQKVKDSLTGIVSVIDLTSQEVFVGPVISMRLIRNKQGHMVIGKNLKGMNSQLYHVPHNDENFKVDIVANTETPGTTLYYAQTENGTGRNKVPYRYKSYSVGNNPFENQVNLKEATLVIQSNGTAKILVGQDKYDIVGKPCP